MGEVGKWERGRDDDDDDDAISSLHRPLRGGEIGAGEMIALTAVHGARVGVFFVSEALLRSAKDLHFFATVLSRIVPHFFDLPDI